MARSKTCLTLTAVLVALGCESGVTDPAAREAGSPPPAFAHGSFTTSDGIYRIPYENGSLVRITRDHHTHTPVNRIDMAGDDPGFVIVAAASGTIRAIVDRHGNSPGAGDNLSANGTQPNNDAAEHSCQDNSTVVGSCSDYNNYVWIEHPNGEWTKYTHFGTGTVTANGWQVGDWIESGEALGIESDIGFASGRHLHFEVARPDDPNDPAPFPALGGFMVPDFGVNLVPRVCGIPDMLFVADEEYTAGPCTNAPPVADAGGPYNVNEGSTVVLDGTGSFDPDGLALTYLWAPADNLDDPTLAQPTFMGVDDGVVILTLTVYDQVEALSATAQTTVTVHNVAPTVTIDPAQVTVIDEGQTLQVLAGFTDPGVDDAPFTADVRCYDVNGYTLTVPGTVNVTSMTGPLQGTVTASCPFGDTSRSGDPPAGTFAVTVRVVDKDGDDGEASFDVTVRNVSPSPQIDESGATVINGVPTFLAAEGETLDFAAQVTDPGSDDLFLTWDWGDGSSSQAAYLLNPPNTDPFPSPNASPRNVADAQSHAWAEACLYTVTLTAVDDDGGEGSTMANVIIAGTSGRARGAGYWLPQYRGNRTNALSAGTLGCYLQIAGHMSAVFDEERSGTGSFDEATDVLHTGGSRGDMTEILDRQLLAAWLNFANGAFGWDDPVDTTGNGVPDTPFSSAISTAEAVRLDPNSTRSELEAQKDVLEAINQMHGG
ncbi:MAG TPA: PKD domain-containing protein [Longimicrobiales bacterium]|nr:PKD domain-containing protein [Longimicrobiales bacterium]